MHGSRDSALPLLAYLGAAVLAHAAVALGAHVTASTAVSSGREAALYLLEHVVEAPALAAPAPVRPPPPEPPPELPPDEPNPPVTPPPKAPDTSPYDDEPRDLAQRARREVADAVGAAAKVLTHEAGADAIATSESDSPGYGLVAGDGLVGYATADGRAILGGRRGGHGSGLGPSPVSTRPDLSRGARVLGGYAEDCEFPIEAGSMSSAVVVVVVGVRADGTAANVAVTGDPGRGFGRVARACALRNRYDPARDREGHPVAGMTGPVNVRFVR